MSDCSSYVHFSWDIVVATVICIFRCSSRLFEKWRCCSDYWLFMYCAYYILYTLLKYFYFLWLDYDDININCTPSANLYKGQHDGRNRILHLTFLIRQHVSQPILLLCDDYVVYDYYTILCTTVVWKYDDHVGAHMSTS